MAAPVGISPPPSIGHARRKFWRHAHFVLARATSAALIPFNSAPAFTDGLLLGQADPNGTGREINPLQM
jgi:hypothetical protein